MREIKFRAWDTIGKRMFHNVGIMANGKICSLDIYAASYHIPYENLGEALDRIESGTNLILMQFTGFRDMNDIEIYEGDILSPVFMTCDPDDHRYENCEVFYNDGCFSIYLSDDYQPCLWEIDNSTCEVIGNAYENPELLSGKDQGKNQGVISD